MSPFSIVWEICLEFIIPAKKHQTILEESSRLKIFCRNPWKICVQIHLQDFSLRPAAQDHRAAFSVRSLTKHSDDHHQRGFPPRPPSLPLESPSSNCFPSSYRGILPGIVADNPAAPGMSLGKLADIINLPVNHQPLLLALPAAVADPDLFPSEKLWKGWNGSRPLLAGASLWSHPCWNSPVPAPQLRVQAEGGPSWPARYTAPLQATPCASKGWLALLTQTHLSQAPSSSRRLDTPVRKSLAPSCPF